jgi:tripartite-type tricarboxylate transporter receptor subunit TctC
MQVALAKPEIRKRLNDLGAVIVGSRPNEFRSFLIKDKNHWRKVIEASGLKPE